MIRKIKEFAFFGVFFVFLYYAGGVGHELMHLGFDYVVTMGETASWDSPPINLYFTSYGVPKMYVQTSGTYIGANLIFATMGTSLLGLLYVYKSADIRIRSIRWAMFGSGVLMWVRYALYGAGFWITPKFTDNGVRTRLTGDGLAALEIFGPIVMVIGVIILIAGAVLVWERIRDSPEACSCKTLRIETNADKNVYVEENSTDDVIYLDD